MKKEGNNTHIFEVEIKITTNILEKKPSKGGTPANDIKHSDNTLVKKLLWVRRFRERNVMRCVFKNWRNVVKKINDVRL